MTSPSSTPEQFSPKSERLHCFTRRSFKTHSHPGARQPPTNVELTRRFPLLDDLQTWSRRSHFKQMYAKILKKRHVHCDSRPRLRPVKSTVFLAHPELRDDDESLNHPCFSGFPAAQPTSSSPSSDLNASPNIPSHALAAGEMQQKELPLYGSNTPPHTYLPPRREPLSQQRNSNLLSRRQSSTGSDVPPPESSTRASEGPMFITVRQRRGAFEASTRGDVSSAACDTPPGEEVRGNLRSCLSFVRFVGGLPVRSFYCSLSWIRFLLTRLLYIPRYLLFWLLFLCVWIFFLILCFAISLSLYFMLRVYFKPGQDAHFAVYFDYAANAVVLASPATPLHTTNTSNLLEGSPPPPPLNPTAVAFVSFDNRTWDATWVFDGISKAERCGYYHQARRRGDWQQAQDLLALGKVIREERADAKIQLIRRFFGPREVFDVVLGFSHTPFYEKPVSTAGLPTQHAYPPARSQSCLMPLAGGGFETLQAAADGTPRSSTAWASPPQPDDVILSMFTLELFDRRCALKARSRRPHFIRYSKRRRQSLPGQWVSSLLSRRPHVQENHAITLMDDVPASLLTPEVFDLARIQVAPPIPFLSARLSITPRIAHPLQAFFRKTPFVSFLIVVCVGTLWGAFTMTAFCWIGYLCISTTASRNVDVPNKNDSSPHCVSETSPVSE